MFDHSHVMYVSTDGSSELDLEHQKNQQLQNVL